MFKLLGIITISIILSATKLVPAYPRRSDLAIILDVSKSISQGAFSDALDFIEQILYRKSISPGTTRIGLITFSSKAYLKFSFQKYVNREGVLKRLESIGKKKLQGKTNINNALKKAIYLFKNYKGFATEKEVYIFSDGKWNDGGNPRNSLQRLKALGVEVFAFGIGRRPKMVDLESLASFPVETHVFMLDGDPRDRQKTLEILTGRIAYGLCSGSGERVDECGRQCKCIDGVLTDCYRIRKEFTSLSLPERKKYMQAYLKLTTKEPLVSRFKKYISKHSKNFHKGIHEKVQFFPWHRWYIYEFENLIREVDCTVTLPYWDWSYYSDVAFEKGQHIWREDEYGLGGDGDRNDSFCVKTGPFRKGVWAPPAPTKNVKIMNAIYNVLNWCTDFETENGTKTFAKCLRRSFHKKPANLSHVLNTINLPCSKYDTFERIVRDDYHNDVHNFIGGTMCSDYAGNSPEFFFHHGFIDNIWYRYQQQWPDCANDYFKMNVFDLISSKYKSNRFINSFDQGESVKVKYADFLSARVDPKVLDIVIKVEARRGNGYGSVRCSSDSGSTNRIFVAPFLRLKAQSKRLNQ